MTTLNNQNKRLQHRAIFSAGIALWSPRKRATVAVSAFVAYAMAFFPLYAWIGVPAAILTLIPVIVTAWLFRSRGGLIAALLAVILNAFLGHLAGGDWFGLFWAGGGLGPLIMVLTGLAIGRLSDLSVSLHESEEHYRTLFENLPIPAFIKDRQGKYINSNAENQKYWAVNPVGLTDAELLPAEEAEALRKADLRVMESGSASNFEEFLENTPLGKRHILSRKVPLYDRSGNISGILGASVDITERKETERARRESEERYRAVVENQTEFIVRWRPDGVRTFVNEAYRRYFGLTSEQAISSDFIPLIVEEDRNAVEEKISRLLSGTVTSETDIHRVIKPDGSIGWQEWVDQAIYDETGQIVEFQSVGRDITERKQAEEEIHKTETQYRILVEQIPPIVYMASLDQHIGVTYISPRIEMLGFTQEEWVADPELWFRQIHPDDQKRVLDEIEEIKTSGKPFKSEYRIRARDGRVMWFLDEAVDVFDHRGNVLFRQGFMLDITERKRAEESLASRQRYLSLLNDMTRTILLSNDFDSTLHTLAINMAKLLDADDCYITRWDVERQWTIPAATTAKLKMPYASPSDVITSAEIDLTTSVLKAGRALAADDVFNSPYISIEIAKRYPARSALGVPLIVGEHKLGAAIIAYNTPHHFTSDEIERAEQAGDQVALALWNFQQSLEIQHRLKESNALTNIGRALGETERGGTDRVLQLIVDSALDLIQQAEESVIHLLDAGEDALVPRAISGFGEGAKASERHKMRLKEGVAGEVIDTGDTINIGDINASPLYVVKETPPTYRSLMVAPVQSGGKPIGTISVQSSKLNAFSAIDAELLNALSIQAAIAIENTRLFETTQQSLKEVNALYRTSQGLASSLDTDELIADVVNLLQQNFGYYHAQIYLLDPSNGDLVLKSGSGEIGARLLEQNFRLPRGTGIVSHVVETATPFVTNDVNAIVFFFRNPLLPDTQSELTVPIKVEGKVMGVLDIQNTPPRRLTNNDLQLMTAVADQLSVALQKASLYTNLQTALQQEQTVRSQLVQSERLALVGRLLASVSHELNNPLQAIQNALFLLKDEEQLSPQGKQDLDVILSEAERMTSLIERLRSAYRPGRVRDFRPVELNDLIEDVHTLIATHMRQKRIVFEFHPDPGLPPISGMSDQIRQVILNLFLNAIEVMNPGGRLTAQTRNLLQQNEVLLTVKDTGPGITPDILPKIFDAFITDKQTGTGLGLTISRDIIEQHFGRIEAENNPEGGAIFNVWLPIDAKGKE